MKWQSRRLVPLFLLVGMACAWGADGPASKPASQPASQPANTVVIAGVVAKPQTWTTAELKTAFAKEMKTVKYTVKDQEHTSVAVPLLSIINTAAVVMDPKIKNDQLRFVVVIEAKDGYMATFAYSELLPTGGNREVWIGLDLDGKPLAERDAPASLIVPGDAKPERFVHGMKTIRIIHIEGGTKETEYSY